MSERYRVSVGPKCIYGTHAFSVIEDRGGTDVHIITGHIPDEETARKVGEAAVRILSQRERLPSE